MSKKIKLTLYAVMVLLALGITLYPLISNRMAERNRSLIETQYTEALEQMEDSTLASAKHAAEEYNATLVSVTDTAYSREALQRASESYETLLDLNDDGIMGYLEIPKIGVDLPIYHGTGEDSLSRGVGHLLGSSLPIGGEATHSILTGHSGLATEKMFSDLDKLERGDIFFLNILGEKLAYMVQDIYTVLPEDTTKLTVEGKHDYCTLITCTPFGINSHRLLVRGERVEYTAAAELVEEADYAESQTGSTWTEAYIRGVGYGLICVAGVTILFFSVRLRIKNHPRKKGKHETA